MNHLTCLLVVLYWKVLFSSQNWEVEKSLIFWHVRKLSTSSLIQKQLPLKTKSCFIFRLSMTSLWWKTTSADDQCLLIGSAWLANSFAYKNKSWILLWCIKTTWVILVKNAYKWSVSDKTIVLIFFSKHMIKRCYSYLCVATLLSDPIMELYHCHGVSRFKTNPR